MKFHQALSNGILIERLRVELQILGMTDPEVQSLVNQLFKEAKERPVLTTEYVIGKLEEKIDSLARGDPK